MFSLSVGAALAPAQVGSPLAFDPSVAHQGTALLVTADESVLAPNGQRANSIAVALARGMQVDPAAREELCQAAKAARSGCPELSRIGFGRFGVAVRGYTFGGGETELTWAVDAFLGEAQRRGDIATVVLTARLLGADSVNALLAPQLAASIPSTTTTVGRLIRRTSGRYGIELQFPKLPVKLDVAAPMTAVPARLELTLSAVRRTRQNFIRHIKIRTPSGSEIRNVHDHRLIGHYLFRTPASCNGSWPSELRVGLPNGVKRTTGRITCARP
jgi:hypothetical protein